MTHLVRYCQPTSHDFFLFSFFFCPKTITPTFGTVDQVQQQPLQIKVEPKKKTKKRFEKMGPITTEDVTPNVDHYAMNTA